MTLAQIPRAILLSVCMTALVAVVAALLLAAALLFGIARAAQWLMAE